MLRQSATVVIVMNATNPFQVPSCFQIDHERRRRERFKRTFIAVLAAGVLLLVGLLIEGCRSEQARVAGTTGVAANIQQSLPQSSSVAAEEKTVSIPRPIPQPAMSQSAAAASIANTPPAGHPETIHVVKAGDTLTRIAREHGTTVKVLEAAIGLASDHIVIGDKLKVPAA